MCSYCQTRLETITANLGHPEVSHGCGLTTLTDVSSVQLLSHTFSNNNGKLETSVRMPVSREAAAPQGPAADETGDPADASAGPDELAIKEPTHLERAPP